jgi:SAM-dependent methyltransferase
MERALVAAGYEVVRLSGGHLQLMFPGRSVSDRFYIDIFAYFVCNGWFYGTFHARERASRVPLLPLRELDVDGRRMPAPADPERLLAAIYGPHWRTPDPAFTFVTPPSALRRFRGWLDDYNMDRENWEDHHRSRIARGDRPEPSPFAVETAELVPVGSRIVELGCGLGADAHHLASRGHEVVAVDYSRPALAYAQAGVTATVGAPRFDRVNLNLDRDAVRLLDDEVTGSGAVHVYGRSLFDALSERATGVTLRLVRQLLRHPDSSAHFEVESGARTRGRQWTEYDGVLLHELERTLASAGLSIAEHRREYENSQHAVERIIVRRDRG